MVVLWAVTVNRNAKAGVCLSWSALMSSATSTQTLVYKEFQAFSLSEWSECEEER